MPYKNIQKRRDSNKKSYYRHKDKIFAQRKERELLNPEFVKNQRKDYHISHRDKLINYARNYYQNNKQKFKDYNRKNIAFKIKTDLNFKLRKNLARRILLSLKGKNKSRNTMKLLGCDLSFIKKYLEVRFKLNMNWENHGLKGWHIDHIIPCKKFDLVKENEQLICFNYRNLRPMWSRDNIVKNDNIDELRMDKIKNAISLKVIK
jgi:hypothetical protein